MKQILKSFARLALAGILAGLGAPSARAQATNCLLPPASFWATNTILLQAADNMPDSFLFTELRGLPPGGTVTNGFYRGWCVDYAHDIVPDVPTYATLYYSYGDLPPPLAHPNWDLVNYLLNHPRGDGRDMQYALWHFIGGPVSPSDRQFYPPRPAALDMIIDALSRGEGFVPAPGQVSAAVLVPEPNRQINIIEIVCPVPPVCVYRDTAYYDLNGTGSREAGEPGAAQTVLALTDCTGLELARTTTDATGAFTFDITNQLPASFRIVLPSPPPAYPLLSVWPGNFSDQARTRCFVLSNDCQVLPPPPLRTAAMGDRVWEDRDANGQQDSGEPGVAGVAVQLWDCQAALVASTTTDRDGAYGFSALLAGTYRVSFARPDGLAFTLPDAAPDTHDSDANEADGFTACLTLRAGETNRTVDAGLVRLGGMAGRAWHDLDHDGQRQEAEPRLPGVTVILSDCAGSWLGVRTTDADGLYSFAGLRAGTYRITVAAPAGFNFTTLHAGDPALDNDVAPASDCITLAAGEERSRLDAGLFRFASVSAFTWQELALDGLRAPEEEGIAGVGVELRRADGAALARFSTDATGSCEFNQLVPGAYDVVLTAPPGCFLLAPGRPGPEAQLTNRVSVLSGEARRACDAGVIVPAVLTQQVWNDSNRDGAVNSGEPTLAGVVVELRDCADQLLALAATDASGQCQFVDVFPGAYRLVVLPPAGQVFSTPGAGPAACQTVAPAESLTNAPVGLIRTGSLGGRAWRDLNANGMQDAGEPALADIVVQLRDCGGASLATTNTATDGSCVFDNLPAGTYQLEYAVPGGSIFTTPHVGAPALDSDVDSGTGQTECVTLEAGAHRRSLDAGCKRALAFNTFTQVEWGAAPVASNAAARLAASFTRVYPYGVTLGDRLRIKFTTARAVQTFLPVAGPPAVLRRDVTNPARTPAGSLPGELLALRFNLDFSQRSLLPTGLGHLRLAPGSKFAGTSVRDLHRLANVVLGGNPRALPAGYTLADLQDTLARINANFAAGADRGWLVP